MVFETLVSPLYLTNCVFNWLLPLRHSLLLFFFFFSLFSLSNWVHVYLFNLFNRLVDENFARSAFHVCSRYDEQGDQNNRKWRNKVFARWEAQISLKLEYKEKKSTFFRLFFPSVCCIHSPLSFLFFFFLYLSFLRAILQMKEWLEWVESEHNQFARLSASWRDERCDCTCDQMVLEMLVRVTWYDQHKCDQLLCHSNSNNK